MSDALKLVGATQEELKDPRVQAALAAIDETPISEAEAARHMIEAVPPPDVVPMASNQCGLEKYGIKLRRKTNIHDLFIARVFALGLPPSEEFVKEFQSQPENKGRPVPDKIIPPTYIPTTFIFIMAAPFAAIEAAISKGEKEGLFAFLEAADQWIADSGIPTNKTEEVFKAIETSFATMNKMLLPALSDDGTPGQPIVKKNQYPGLSPSKT
jgi:hypothetical protein